MNIIRAELAPEFRGEDVVLLAMDDAGVTTFLTPLRDAGQRGASQLEQTNNASPIRAAQLILNSAKIVVWRLDHAKAAEIVEDPAVMSNNDRPGHNYVDISSPTKTSLAFCPAERARAPCGAPVTGSVDHADASAK
jgi:hypothetical protein